MYNNIARFKTGKYGVYGEVVNTADCGSAMRRFDPCYTPQNENERSKDFPRPFIVFISAMITLFELKNKVLI